MKQKYRLASILIFIVIVAVLLTGCGGGGGGGGSSGGGPASSIAPVPDPVPTPTPDPDPDPDPPPTPDYRPTPGTTVIFGDPKMKVCWEVEITSNTTGTIVGYNKEISPSPQLPQKLIFPSQLEGYTITAIEGYSYRDENIVELTVPDSVTKIGQSTFSGMKNLTTVTIKGPATLGKYLFYDCSNLKEVTLNDGITEIPSYAFAGCRAIQKINFPAKLEKIGDYAFRGSLGIESENGIQLLNLPEFPDTLTSIGESAFEGAGISGITIPSGVRRIEKNAFRNCGIESKGLEYIKLEPGVEEIGEGAFEGTRFGMKIHTIYLPHSIKHIEKNAFMKCTWKGNYGIYYEGSESEWRKGVSIDAGNQNWSDERLYCGVTPGQYDSIRNKTPDEVEWQFDLNDTDLILSGYDKDAKAPSGNVVLPDAVTTVRRTIPVTSIGAYAFSYCTQITSVSLPGTLQTISNGAFSGCTALQQIALPEGLQTIGENAFYGCTSLRQINFPEGLQMIGANAFARDHLVGEITIPAGVTKIGNGAFSSNEYLEKVVIKGNPYFESEASGGIFSGCINLREVRLNDSITELSDWMFWNCGIERIKLPSSLKRIGKETFSSLKATELRLPDTVTTIGEDAFDYSSLRRVALSKSMTTIPYRAFYWSSRLSAVYIPDSVTSIESSAFENCNRLKDIYYSGSESDWMRMNIERTGNETLTTATVHYNASVSDLGLTSGASLLSLFGF